MSEIADAHFLHQKRGLQAVLRPSVRQPTHIVWSAAEREFIVACSSGAVERVHPALGTRPLTAEGRRVSGLATSEHGTAVVRADGTWRVLDPDGVVVHSGEHHYLGSVRSMFIGKRLLLLGVRHGVWTMSVIVSGKLTLRVQLPPRSHPVAMGDSIGLMQVTPDGIEVIPLRAGSRFKGAIQTPHQIRMHGASIVGLLSDSVSVWRREGGGVRSLRVPGLTAAALSDDGEWLAVGRRDGSACVVPRDALLGKGRPQWVRAYGEAVRCLCFGGSGAWLATGGPSLVVWTWE